MEKIEVMSKLGDWFKEFGWDIYFNQKNQDDYDVFHSNSNSKPDMLLTKNGYNVLVETKVGEKHKDLLDGIDQIFRYIGEYYTGRRKYYLKSSNRDDNIDIDAFCLATNFSDSGYLYSDEDSVGYLKHRYLTKKYNLIEKPVTHSLTRFIWRQWEKGFVVDHFRDMRKGDTGEDVILPLKPYIGTILAKIKDTRQVTSEPYMFLNSNEFISMNYNKIYCFER